MPFLPGKEVHELYGPGSRKVHFPAADWAFLIQTATNCAVAFDALHASGPGIAMGDVNERNVFVTTEALVRLLDCDSFQITAGGQSFPCGVGVPTYTPPELQGQSLRTVVRTHNHDRFGLAVLIFQLLFVGRHPFCGRPLTRRDLSFEEAIKEFRFAYSRAAAQLQITPPLYAPLLGIVPAEIGRLFERAFSKHSAQPDARPKAQEWADALSALQKQLKTCARDPGHKYSAHLGQCCWCELMDAGAPNYFISVSVSRIPTLTFALGGAWAEIDRLPRPNVTYTRPPIPDTIAPTVLPAHIPSRVPAPVFIPIPPEPPEPPAVAIPLPPKPHDPPHPRVQAIPLPPKPAPIPSSLSRPIVIPRGTFHKALAWASVASACLLLATLFMALAMNGPSYGPHDPGRNAVVSAIIFILISACAFGSAWLALEVRPETTVFGKNAGRNAALAKHRREIARWDDAYRNAVNHAKAEKDKAWAEWRREKERREAAYRNAIQSVVAEQDRISAEKRRVKAQREEAHRNAVRLANAKRDAVLADMRREKERRLQVYRTAYSQLEEAENEWKQTASRYEQSFDGLKCALERLKTDYLSLKPQYEQEYRELERNKEATQRVQFLQTQFISDHTIEDIGPTREAVLRSNGIETAYDIEQDRILAIKGFGRRLTDKLVAWRRRKSGEFRFNAAAAISTSELAALNLKYKEAQQRIEAKLHSGLAKLRDCAEKANRDLSQRYARISELVLRLAQAQVDAQVLSEVGI